jgi:predicted metalloprotease with PDZ domain
MEDYSNRETFSSFIEYLMTDAPLEKKREAQKNLDAFMDVMWRICTRLVAEGHTAETLGDELNGIAVPHSKVRENGPGK